jgi:hypothetical protein
MAELHSSISTLRRRGSRSGQVGLRWMYALVGLPVITAFIETGNLPGTPRE